ncbi:MAG: hypothetical protein PHQ80_02530 [Candidatus ainarchaeum sp.]|nr:hypothetical protein [Candidatus ainarchaeum sp.]
MADRGVARILSVVPPAPGESRPRKSIPPFETPENALRRVVAAYHERGMGIKDVFSAIFGPGHEAAAKKVAERLDSFTETDLRDSFAISLLTVHEYTKSAEYALKTMDFCSTASGRAGASDASEACTASHIARIVSNIGTRLDHNPSDTLDLLFGFSESEHLMGDIIRIIMCLSRISVNTYEPRVFNEVLRATRMLSQYSPSSIPCFVSSMARLSDQGEIDAVWNASGAMVTIWTLRKCCVAYMMDLMEAVHDKDPDGISGIADDLRAIMCDIERRR